MKEGLEPEVEQVVLTEERREGEGACPGQGPEPVCLSVQVLLTWHLLPLGLWTVNRSGWNSGKA